MLKLEKNEHSYIFSRDVKIKPSRSLAGTGGSREAPVQQVLNAKLSSSSLASSWGTLGAEPAFGVSQAVKGEEREGDNSFV